MMTSMTLIWTTLPAGIRRVDGDWQARISVFLTPRLEVPDGGDLTLSAFPAFVDWPATLRAMASDGIGFHVQVCTGEKIVADTTRHPLSGSSLQHMPDSAAWRGIFSESMPVRAFEGPKTMLTAAPVQSYPADKVIDRIRRTYAEALAHDLGRTAPPSLSAFTVGDGRQDAGRSAADDPLQRFVRFHQESSAAGRLTAAPDDDCADFHQVVGALGTHPHLLRRLGLVLDITLPAGELGLDVPDRKLLVQAVPVCADVGVARHMCPWTAVEYDSAAGDDFRVFTAAQRNGVRHGGFHPLGGRRTSIAQEKLEHAVFSLMQQAGEAPARQLPALLQGGMRLTRGGTTDAITTAMADQAKLERDLERRGKGLQSGMLACAPGDEPLFAEQLTRGYRIDVRDIDTGRWRSLCRRHGRYRSGDWSWPIDGVLEDEGVIEPAASGGPSALRMTEDLFEWDGWSLSVPRPDGSTDEASPPDRCAADGGPPLTADFAVPAGSLQPQRFGRCYQFRARAVDLAGNSLSTEDADQIASGLPMDRLATRPECCLRVESAKPPVIFRAQPRGPGETGDMIVLREADAPEHRTDSVRVHVLPPAVSLRIAEKHGLFDGMPAADSWRLISSHRGRLGFENPEGKTADEPGDDQVTIREPSAAKEIYAPYLPDPMVRQAVLVLPDGGGSAAMPPFDDLPRGMRGRRLARSCSLVVGPGGQRIKATVKGRQVTITVPRGRVQEIRIAARLSRADIAIAAFAHNDWHPLLAGDDMGAAEARKELAIAAASGEAPLLAPSRTVRIVYATPRPLTEPAFGRPLILPRSPNATTATLADDALALDRPSTGRIDIYARWDDPVDDPADSAWRTTRNELHAGGVTIDENDGNPLAPDAIETPARSPLAHDFGDTRHHRVTYRAVGTSRFVGFYPASLTENPQNVTRQSSPVTLHVPSTAPPAPPDIAYVVPTFRRSGPSGDGRIAAVEQNTAQIGEGLRVYMNRGWFSSGAGEQLALIVGTPNTPGALLPNVSAWGMNPLRDAAPLPGPLQLAHVWGGATRFNAWPLDGGTVGMVACDVAFSDEHGLPFADIVFLSQRAFMPFVRLALARYQPHAIDGCKLSRIVHADFVPLAPGRAVTVRKTGPATWHLSMRGYSYRQPGHGTSHVQAHIECMDSALPETAASWRPLGEPVILKASSTETWRYHWTGQVRIDDQRLLAIRWRRRLVIQEFEPFESAGGPDVPLADRSRLISAHAVPI